MSVSNNDALQVLKSHMPGGMERWQNITSSGYIGKLWTAIAQSIKLYGYDMLDTLRSELRAATMSERVPDWESTLGLENTRIANGTSMAKRRGQIVARRRESGASSIPNIKASLAAVCGYEPEIIEHDRTSLSTLNSYSAIPGGDPISAGPGTDTWTFTAADNAPVSDAGLRFALEIDHAAISDLTITITAPDATTKSWDGADFTSTVQRFVWWPEAAGKTISGTWTVEIANAGATAGTVDLAIVYVEGIGRAGYFSTTEGLGSAIFEWAARVDPALVDSSTFDAGAAREIVRRWNQAHCRGYFVLTGVGDVTADAGIWGDPTNSVWDGFIWE